MAFQGSLTELPLPDIIQLVSVSGKSGKFTLTREGDEGVIYLRNGQIVHAHTGELSGEEAIYALAIWNQGDFVFAPTEEVPEQTIQRSNTNLLMEAARRMDEWRVLSKKIPSVELIPELAPRAQRHEQITINPQEWLLVTRIDGRKSISEIARAIELSSFDVSKILYGMVTAELVVLKKRAEKPRPAPVAAPAPAPVAAPPPPPAPAAAAPPPPVPVRGPVAAPPPAPAAPRGGDPEVEALLDLALRIRGLAEQHLGPAGLKSLERHYGTAVEAIRGGSGSTAVREMIRELEKTTSILRGSDVAEQLRGQIAELLRMAS